MPTSRLLVAIVATAAFTAKADVVSSVSQTLIPGSLVTLATPVGDVFEVVLATEGPRTLVLRFGEPRWELTQNLLEGARIQAPVPNPYRAVLAPVYAEAGRVVLGFDVIAVTSVVQDQAGRQMVIGGDGRGYAIGVHGTMPGELRENIPVRGGQTFPEAIREFNARAREHGSDRVMNENARLDRSRETRVIDVGVARAQADAGRDVGLRRAERAVGLERGAGERANLREAIRRGKDVR